MNLLQYAANEDAAFRQNWLEMNNYEINSTWCADLIIAMVYEHLEPGAIDDTINNAVKDWKTNFSMFIELIMAVNWLSWLCYRDKTYNRYTAKFVDWYHKLYNIAYKTFSKEEIVKMHMLLD